MSRFSLFLSWIDRWFLQLVCGSMVFLWVWADYIGLVFSEGTKAAIGTFTLYTVTRRPRDERWRRWELDSREHAKIQALIADLEQTTPGSRSATAAREALVAATLQQRALKAAEEDREK